MSLGVPFVRFCWANAVVVEPRAVTNDSDLWHKQSP